MLLLRIGDLIINGVSDVQIGDSRAAVAGFPVIHCDAKRERVIGGRESESESLVPRRSVAYSPLRSAGQLVDLRETCNTSNETSVRLSETDNGD